MCIWSVKPEDRHCEFCSYRGGCERYPIVVDRYRHALEKANRYISLMSEAVGEDIMVRSRKNGLVWARNIVLYMLRMDGFTLMSIERATGMSYTTVIHATNQVREMLKRPNMYPEETKLWQKFLSLQKI